MAIPHILGIVNITEDSFSDGGKFLNGQDAIDHALRLMEKGADLVDLGACSSNPAAHVVTPGIEKERLTPVIGELKKRGIPISVDTFQTEVQRFCLAMDVEYINDIQAFPDPEIYEELAGASCKLILMHSIQRKGIATTDAVSDLPWLWNSMIRFFNDRITSMVQAGVSRSRLILDPGMGFFLGANPDASFFVLQRIAQLKEQFQLPVLISVSRKSFLGSVTDRSVEMRGAATLSAELFAADQGADYIRTHDAHALRDALLVRKALGKKMIP